MHPGWDLCDLCSCPIPSHPVHPSLCGACSLGLLPLGIRRGSVYRLTDMGLDTFQSLIHVAVCAYKCSPRGTYEPRVWFVSIRDTNAEWGRASWVALQSYLVVPESCEFLTSRPQPRGWRSDQSSGRSQQKAAQPAVLTPMAIFPDYIISIHIPTQREVKTRSDSP